MNEITFTAIIKSSQIGKGGSYVEFPFSVEEKFDKKGRIKVKCLFNNEQYRGSLVKMRTDCHIIGITKEILIKINKKTGDEIIVKISEDTDDRIIEINPLLNQELEKNILLKTNYEKLSFTKRKEINESLNSAKKVDTFRTRLQTIIKDLS